MIEKAALCIILALLAPAPEDGPGDGHGKADVKQPETTAADAVEKTAVDKTAVDKAAADDLELLAIEKNIIIHTNAQRARYGLKPLEIDEGLMKWSRGHASWMARTRKFVHSGRPAAENIASGQKDSKAAVTAWMNSAGHRANILNRGYMRIGAAAYRTPKGRIYWCQQFRR